VSGPDGLGRRARWSEAEAWAWRERTGWLLGCNFVPSTAGNQLELWQETTFDPATIDRELGWAADVVGMNVIRLFLHDLVWSADGDAFLDRVDRVLDLAADHGIRAMPVLFDGIWDPEPRLGPQGEPRPLTHNSMWVQGPGASVVGDRSRWPSLRPYVDVVLGRFGRDERVVAWDLFNEPDSPNWAHADRDPPEKATLMGELVELVWEWAAEADPRQPLTVGLYAPDDSGGLAETAPVARAALERSDVVSFHSYGGEAELDRFVIQLGDRRPSVCTEWLARPSSPPAQVDQFRRLGVDAITWGLVDGRTQTRWSWLSWWQPPADDEVWFHDLLHADGRPYDDAEVEVLRRAAGRA
jgi:hypothetical protein